jgi:hypothetical protein
MGKQSTTQGSESDLELNSFLYIMRKIIAFACGSLDFNYPDSLRSSFQHILILSLREWIIESKVQFSQISCYFQDPAYTENDKKAIEKSNGIILDDPERFLEIDESTIIFSCASQIPVKQIVMEFALSALIIWDRDEPRHASIPDHIVP